MRLPKGLQRYKPTFDQKAENMVEFAKVMLRKPISLLDAKCIIANLDRWGPKARYIKRPETGGKSMPRTTNAKTVRKAKKAAKRTAKKAGKAPAR